MANPPFWQYFAVEEPQELILPPTNRLHAAILMSVVFIIISIQVVYYISKLRETSDQSASRATYYYIIMFLGTYAITINSTFIRLSIYYTNGQYTILSQQKAFLFFTGTAMIMYGLTKLSFSIIDFRKRTKSILRGIYYTFMITVSTVIVVILFVIIGFEQFNELVLSLESLSAAIAMTLMVIFIIALILEARSNPSKIEQLRLNLLSISVFLLTIIYLVTGSTSAFKDPTNPDFFIQLTTYIVPLTYLLVKPVMLMVLFWSLLTPNWLLVKSGVIQPSFKDFLERRKNK